MLETAQARHGVDCGALFSINHRIVGVGEASIGDYGGAPALTMSRNAADPVSPASLLQLGLAGRKRSRGQSPIVTRGVSQC